MRRGDANKGDEAPRRDVTVTSPCRWQLSSLAVTRTRGPARAPPAFRHGTMEVDRKSRWSSSGASHSPAQAVILVIPVPRVVRFGSFGIQAAADAGGSKGRRPGQGESIAKNVQPPRSLESAVSGFWHHVFSQGWGCFGSHTRRCAGACARQRRSCLRSGGCCAKKKKEIIDRAGGRCWGGGFGAMPGCSERPRGCITLGRAGQQRSRVLTGCYGAP